MRRPETEVQTAKLLANWPWSFDVKLNAPDCTLKNVHIGSIGLSHLIRSGMQRVSIVW